MSANLRSWLLALGSLITGIGLLWWAQQQWLSLNQVLVEGRQFPAGRLLVWMLTLIVTGFLVGMAASSARGNHERTRPGIVLALSFIPFAALYYFWTQVSLGWFPQLPGAVFDFLYDDRTLLAAAMILGFFLSGLIGGPADVGEPVEEPSDVRSDDEGNDDSEE